MNVYMCCRCGGTAKSNGDPDSYDCPASGRTGYSSHSWYNLGSSGDDAYKCDRCGKVVYTSGSPDSNGCPASESTGYSTHSWSRC